MCGIAGFLLSSPDKCPGDIEQIARSMGDSLRHRGPDAGDVWLDKKNGVAFSHRRLSIIDLTEAGAQPMVSSCERYVICYNGEIYNADELRNELVQAGRSFRGYSDTEVIIEGCAVWGAKETARRIIGMFSFALWDKCTQTLALVRDRIGIKPLYIGEFNGSYVFASELKAVQVFTQGVPEIDKQSVASYLFFGYVPTPQSIFEGVRKLEPGHVLSLKRGVVPQDEVFWSLAEEVVDARKTSPILSSGEWQTKVERLIKDAVKRRMVSDVPLGAFLSGGIDSSLVVAMMQEVADRPVKSFSIGFPDTSYNEACHAKVIADYLSTEHTELYMGEKDLLDIVPCVPGLYDEPFSDSSSIPTHALSKLTRGEVTVALSGDGGDELFAGYSRYTSMTNIDVMRSRIPGSIRKLLAATITSVPAVAYDWLFTPVSKVCNIQAVGYRAHKLADVINAETPDEAYRVLISFWRDFLPKGVGLTTPDAFISVPAILEKTEEHMQFIDLLTYLPDDILVKVDRASMASSLEVRVPLLDHRIVELSWQLPFYEKMQGGTGKIILRDILAKYVPRKMFERPKMGFGVPLASWLRGPLKAWCEGLVMETDWCVFGLDGQRVRLSWEQFLKHGNPSAYRIWVLIALASWHRTSVLYKN